MSQLLLALRLLCLFVVILRLPPLSNAFKRRPKAPANALTTGWSPQSLSSSSSGALAAPEDRAGVTTGARYDDETVFRAFWDVPHYCAEKHGIEIPLADFGIEFNSNNDWHHGDVINVLSHSNIGYYPYLGQDNRFVNGGLPQLGNITAHLEKAAADILAGIPNHNFNGIGMIDWEAWYPQWDSIERRYQSASRDHVRALHPDWDDAAIDLVAELEWMQGAKLFMESTVKLARQLRPKAVWGFYHYPYCNTYVTGTSCQPGEQAKNDEIGWLFNETTVIYPSIYLTSKMESAVSVEVRLAEAFRMRDKSSDPQGVVLSYTRFNYSQTGFYYTLEDLNNTILRSAEFGTHGVVFWGDNFDDQTTSTCQELRTYVVEALGPAVVMAREGARDCSQRICSGRGRCVGKILTCRKSDKRRSFVKGWNEPRKSSTCSCRCFRGWRGTDCSKAA